MMKFLLSGSLLKSAPEESIVIFNYEMPIEIDLASFEPHEFKPLFNSTGEGMLLPRCGGYTDRSGKKIY